MFYYGGQQMKNALVLIIIFIFSFCLCQEAVTPIIIGDVIEFDSKILNEKRNIFIYKPFGYDQSEEHYPVLYLLDGETHFFHASATVSFQSANQAMPNTLVVGIPNTERNRDFTPTIEEGRTIGGGADSFLAFLEQELIPYIDNNYRTHSYRTLFGHSLCGLFSVYALFSKPDLFASHIAVSPYIMYDNEYTIKHAKRVLKTRPGMDNSIYMTIGDEPEYTQSLKLFTNLLTRKAKKLNWKLEKFEEEDHGTVPLYSLIEGLKYIHHNWRLSDEEAYLGVNAIKKHYADLSERYGYQIQPAEVTINIIGYQLLRAGEKSKAIKIFKYNTELYPNSANVWDSLGDGYDSKGETELALESYRKAVDLGRKNNDPNLRAFRNNLKRLEH
jgi:predicted alpha/beta superfamily hydrolase